MVNVVSPEKQSVPVADGNDVHNAGALPVREEHVEKVEIKSDAEVVEKSPDGIEVKLVHHENVELKF